MKQLRNRGLKRRLFAALREQSPVSAEVVADALGVSLGAVLQATYPSTMANHRRDNPDSPWVQQIPRLDGGYDLQLCSKPIGANVYVVDQPSLMAASKIIDEVAKTPVTVTVESFTIEAEPDITAIKTVDDLINYVELLEKEVTKLKRENFDMKRTLDRLQSRITSVVIKPVITPTDDDECD